LVSENFKFSYILKIYKPNSNSVSLQAIFVCVCVCVCVCVSQCSSVFLVAVNCQFGPGWGFSECPAYGLNPLDYPLMID
jgi:hypothetical protein